MQLVWVLFAQSYLSLSSLPIQWRWMKLSSITKKLPFVKQCVLLETLSCSGLSTKKETKNSKHVALAKYPDFFIPHYTSYSKNTGSTSSHDATNSSLL